MADCLCANCDRRFLHDGPASPYCSLQCKDGAKAVRYARKVYAEFGYVDIPEDLCEAMTMKIGHALAGGYDEVARTLSAETRAAVKARDGGKCVLCGEPGTEIDHVKGPSPDMSNLRLLCGPCHRKITFALFVPIKESETRERAEWLWTRAHESEPLLPCDRADWTGLWRAWVRANTQ